MIFSECFFAFIFNVFILGSSIQSEYQMSVFEFKLNSKKKWSVTLLAAGGWAVPVSTCWSRPNIGWYLSKPDTAAYVGALPLGDKQTHLVQSTHSIDAGNIAVHDLDPIYSV